MRRMNGLLGNERDQKINICQNADAILKVRETVSLLFFFVLHTALEAYTPVAAFSCLEIKATVGFTLK